MLANYLSIFERRPGGREKHFYFTLIAHLVHFFLFFSAPQLFGRLLSN